MTVQDAARSKWNPSAKPRGYVKGWAVFDTRSVSWIEKTDRHPGGGQHVFYLNVIDLEHAHPGDEIEEMWASCGFAPEALADIKAVLLLANFGEPAVDHALNRHVAHQRRHRERIALRLGGDCECHSSPEAG
jgi:hypothetical protein